MAMEVEVVRSARRRKTVQARLVGGVLQVSIPARVSKAEEERWVREMVGRFERKRATEPIDVAARAEVLAVRHGLPRASSVRWVDNQVWRWGSCTPADRSIRVSSRVADFPTWVLDAVLMHELAHLAEPGHGPAFWAIANRYPRMERARGFLIAKGLEGDGDDDTDEDEAQPTLW
jgi:predicted metal-dependent hydrolase